MTSSTGPVPPGMATVFEEAARQALHAPSILNSQPWRWRVGPDRLELFADRGRQLAVIDPVGRLLVISCGAALHHARVALAAAGYQAEVSRLPDPAESDLLAVLRIAGRCQPDEAAVRFRDAIPRRRTDRRAYGDSPVPDAAVQRLREIVATHGAYLHVVRPDQMPMLAVATGEAGAAERADPAYRDELARWTNRPDAADDGVPVGTAVRQEPRRVPIRDYAPGGQPGLEVGDGTDRGATYVVLFGRSDGPADWLRAGEALSALLLTAVDEGLSAAPLSDPVEVNWPRRLTRGLLSEPGEPFLVVRVGVGPDPADLPPAPRRDPREVIEVSE
ncbi:MAG TPA: nitroreductase [Micromonosporaceae bacterium]